jgi:hypothetical protein
VYSQPSNSSNDNNDGEKVLKRECGFYTVAEMRRRVAGQPRAIKRVLYNKLKLDSSKPQDYVDALFKQAKDKVIDQLVHEIDLNIKDCRKIRYNSTTLTSRQKRVKEELERSKNLTLDLHVSSPVLVQGYISSYDPVLITPTPSFSEPPVEDTTESLSTGFYMSCGKAYSSKADVPLGQVATYVPCLLGGGKTKKRKSKFRPKRKRTIRKQPMISSGQLGLRIPPQMKANYPYVREFWRYNLILETDGSGSISAFVSLRNPLAAINGSGTYPRAADLAVVYDEFKPINVATVLDFLFINPQQGDIAISTDYDSIPAGPYTYTQLVDTQYARIFNGTNQIQYSTRVPKLSEGTYRERPAIIHQGGFYDFNSPPDEGFIAIAAERYVPNTRLFRLTVMMEVVMRRRRTLNITKEEEEEIVPTKSSLDKKKNEKIQK